MQMDEWNVKGQYSTCLWPVFYPVKSVPVQAMRSQFLQENAMAAHVSPWNPSAETSIVLTSKPDIMALQELITAIQGLSHVNSGKFNQHLHYVLKWNIIQF